MPAGCSIKASKKYAKGQTKALELLTTLNSAATTSFTFGPSLTTEGFHQQSYQAVKLEGSAHYLWIYPWICQPKSSSFKLPTDGSFSLDTVVTGTCLFGNHLVGLGSDGNSYLLTDTKAIIPNEVTIVKVSEIGKKHAYELLIHQQLAFLYPLLKSIGSSDLTLQFHLPTAEYILQGIQWYQNGKIKLPALQEYISAVVQRGWWHRMLLRYFTLQTKAAIEVGSPLTCLELESLYSTSPADLVTTLAEFDLAAAFSKLASIPAWASFLATNKVESFADLAYASYSVQVAMHSKVPLKTAVVDINNEIPICLNYQRKILDAVPVLALHWLPAVAPSNSLGSWYLTKSSKEEQALNCVIRHGLFAKATTKPCLTTLMLTDDETISEDCSAAASASASCSRVASDGGYTS